MTDFQAQYAVRALVPDANAIIEGWAPLAAAYRAQRPPETVAYGERPRERMDLFAAGEGPWVMFIHGGYWQALDGSSSSHLARGLNARGVSVAIPSYDLCPTVGVADIIEQMRAAARLLAERTARPLVVAGHSAGGHLAACLLAAEPQVRAAYAISGLFDLEPLLSTSINQALGLDGPTARRLSPLNWTAPEGKRLDAVVGADESDAFHRQSRAVVARWGEAGVLTRYDAIPATNHFTVIEPLADPDSAMVARLAELAAAQ